MATRNANNDAEMRRSQVTSGIVSAQAEVIRQQEAIRQLLAENEKLKKEIAAVSGDNFDYVRADKFSTLKGEVNALERRYQFEKMKKNELMKQYQLARIDLLQGRRLRGGVNAEKENAEMLQRQVEILEGRLDRALTKFNDAISYNKELRDHIDIIREERRIFQRVYKKLENDLRAKKKLMSERIEQSNKDMDERDGYLRQVEQLQNAIKKQKQEYDEKVRELDAAMVEINDMRDEQQRQELELEARQYEAEYNVDSFLSTNYYGVVDSGTGKRHQRVDERAETPPTDLNDVDEKDSAVDNEQDLNEVLAQLKEFAQDGDLVKLAKQYESLGEANFSLYKFINELTRSREEMEREICMLKSVIAEEHEHEERQRGLIKDLEKRLADTEELLQSLYLTKNDHTEALANIRGVTEEIFTECGCTIDDEPLSIDGTVQCTETNHLRLLGLIEERVTAIMCAFCRYKRQEALRAEAEAYSAAKIANAKEKEFVFPINNNRGEEEENALTLTDNSQPMEENREDAVAIPESEEITPLTIEDISQVIPMVQVPKGQRVSAVRLVRQSNLPSAHRGHDEGSDVREDGDGARVISHEEIRRQMERRLVLKREREERAQRKKREVIDQMNSQTSTSQRRL